MPSCCGLKFKDGSALSQHQKAKHPVRYSCTQCSRFFTTTAGLADHKRDLHDSPIRNGKKKSSPKGAAGQLVKPQGKKDDYYCGDCCKAFVDAHALKQHRQSRIHRDATEFRCCDCKRDFVSLGALQQHLQDKVHKPPQKPKTKAPKIETPKKTQAPKKPEDVRPGTPRCPDCGREFHSERALRDHEASMVHRLARNLVCVLGGDSGGGSRSCNQRFKSPSAMLLHLESGGCPSGMTRAKLNVLVLGSDTDGIISNPNSAVQGLLREATQRLATSGQTTTTRTAPGFRDDDSSDDSGDDEAILTPSSTTSAMDGAILTPSSAMVSASPLASLSLLTPSPFSGQSTTSAGTAVIASASGATRCPLCPPTRRPFATPTSLQYHLLSPVHDTPIFHCPVLSPSPSRSGLAVKWFSTLSAMGQHLESGACVESAVDFDKAVSYLKARIMGFGLALRQTIYDA